MSNHPENSKANALRGSLRYFAQRLRNLLIANPLATASVFILIAWFGISALVYHFEIQAKDHNIQSKEDAVWWGIVTLLTVGYGDRYPVSTAGRIFGGLLMIFGVCGIAIVTAKVSSYFLERALRERRGIVDTRALKNHFVIAGWKEEMIRFLNFLLDANPSIKDSDLVLVNSAPESELDRLHEIPRLRGVKIVHGDHFLEESLRRAAPERAAKILILADATPGPNGQKPTVTEADARTIMAAMSLNTLAKGVPITAEIIDAAMDQYLRLAHVNEIVYSRQVSRLLLASATGGVGIANVYHELLSPEYDAFVNTKSIPSQLLGKTYKDLLRYFIDEVPGETLIGLLENSGNIHAAKDAALKRAEHTPNVAELVRNLQKVKALKFNHPIFNPGHEYPLEEGVRAIVIEQRRERTHG